MKRSPTGERQGPRFARQALADRLRGRRDEIEEGIMARAYAVAEPVSGDAEYITGLRAAIAAAIEHGLSALEESRESGAPVPQPLLAQARMAARVGVSLDTMLRRYFAGYTLLLDFILTEARNDRSLGGSALQEVLRCQSIVHERVVEAVSQEYANEREGREGWGGGRQGQIVRRPLSGEPLDASLLDYRIEGPVHHGLLIQGEDAEGLVSWLAESRGYRKLLVDDDQGIHWVWFGAREAIDLDTVMADVLGMMGDALTVAMGEPASGLAGWRLTHRQAKAAMVVALRGESRVTRYRDVALTVSLLQDELLSDSLRELYLAPLAGERDGGEGALLILRAFFKAERNVSSAAAALRMDRHTVARRLRTIDDRLGGALTHRGADLEIALRLDEV